MSKTSEISLLRRIADAFERLAPSAPTTPDLDGADAFVWQSGGLSLSPVKNVNRLALDQLIAIDRVKEILLRNTSQFVSGGAANNALLWGARGMGKSSLVKAVHGHLVTDHPGCLKLIEIHREDIGTLPTLLAVLTKTQHRCILFCDDLSFDSADSSYKSLKAVLEGGIEGRPENVIFYATSNRRHMMPRDMMENERSTAINPSESVEEKVSLSDRFGLWLGFHSCSQDDYLEMVRSYADRYGLQIANDELKAKALEWSLTRGARSGRVAWQFIQDLVGRRDGAV